MRARFVFLPVELQRRELDGIDLLVESLLNVGFNVVVGEQNHTMFKFVKGGLLLHKDWASWSLNFIRHLKSRKVKIALFDIEGLINRSDQFYIEKRVCEETMQEADILFFWGKSRLELLKDIAPGTKRRIISGSLAFDAYSSLRSLQRDRGKRKNILVNTRFGSINGLRGDAEVDNLIRLGVQQTDADIQSWNNIVKRDALIFEEFIKFIKLCSENESINVRVRVHPSESRGFYEELSKEFDFELSSNMKLSKDLLWADLLVQDDCTTAIEARAIGLKVVGLRPNKFLSDSSFLISRLTVNYDSAEELYDMVALSDIDVAMPEECDVEDYISNFPLKAERAFEVMTKAFTQENVKETSKYFILLLALLDIKYWIDILLKWKIFQFFFPSMYRGRKIVQEKFPINMKLRTDKNKERQVFSSRFVSIYS